jgi:hypothetical protein
MSPNECTSTDNINVFIGVFRTLWDNWGFKNMQGKFARAGLFGRRNTRVWLAELKLTEAVNG